MPIYRDYRIGQPAGWVYTSYSCFVVSGNRGDVLAVRYRNFEFNKRKNKKH